MLKLLQHNYTCGLRNRRHAVASHANVLLPLVNIECINIVFHEYNIYSSLFVIKYSFVLLSDRSSFSSTQISAEKLRTLRASIVNANDGGTQQTPFAAITNSADFYSTSGFRDMMAHPVVSCNVPSTTVSSIGESSNCSLY